MPRDVGEGMSSPPFGTFQAERISTIIIWTPFVSHHIENKGGRGVEKAWAQSGYGLAISR